MFVILNGFFFDKNHRKNKNFEKSKKYSEFNFHDTPPHTASSQIWWFNPKKVYISY
mgnify:CR=1 FL=1